MATADQWLAKCANLRVDRARGDPAPHKPLLLLSVLDLAQESCLPPDILPLSPDLAFRFDTYWSIVTARRKQLPDVRYPFHHLSTDGFWSVVDEDGRPSEHRTTTRYGALPSDFVRFAQDPAMRDKARHVLIAKYFQPHERVALYALIGLPVPSDEDLRRSLDQAARAEAQMQGREARFKIRVTSAYGYACALTGYRLTTISSGSIVDAAHIHQFANSRNNDPRNGLALCKNAHWLFDQGLWSVSDGYKIVVAVGHFSESCPDGCQLADYNGRSLRLPADRALWPNPLHLAWHRKNVFRGRLAS